MQNNRFQCNRVTTNSMLHGLLDCDSLEPREIDSFFRTLRNVNQRYVVFGYLDENTDFNSIGNRNKLTDFSEPLPAEGGEIQLNIHPKITTDPLQQRKLSDEIIVAFYRNHLDYSNMFGIQPHFLDMEFYIPLDSDRLAVVYRYQKKPSLVSLLPYNGGSESFFEALNQAHNQGLRITDFHIENAKTLIGMSDKYR